MNKNLLLIKKIINRHFLLFVVFSSSFLFMATFFTLHMYSANAAGEQLIKAVNFNGSQLTVDGVVFQAESTSGVTTNGRRFANQSISLSPSVSTNKAQMIRSSVWRSSVGTLTVNVPIANGTYDIYMYSWEDSSPATFSLALEGRTVASNLNSGAKGSWKRLGPYTTVITDGNVSLLQTGGDFNLSGMEIYATGSITLSPTEIPSLTATSIPTAVIPTTVASTTPLPTNVVIPTLPPTGSTGALHVSADKRYLVKNDGTPFFWLGDTAWSVFTKLTREEMITYLNAKQSQGFNVIQAVAIFPDAGPRGPNKYGDNPINGSVANPITTIGSNPSNATEYDYWDHVDYFITEAEKRGIYVAFLPVWSHNQAGSIVTSSNAEGYGQFLGQRYANNNLIWVFGGDDANTQAAIWRAMAKGIAIGMTGTEDYSKMLMTYHPIGNQTSATTFHNDTWLDFDMVQSGHCLNDALSYDLIQTDYARNPIKPVIDGEPLYEDHLICWQTSQGYSTPHQVRKFAYWSVFAGAFGHTYGHHSVWQFYSGSNPVTGARVNWTQAMNASGAMQMQYLKKLVESRPYLIRIPDQSIITTAAGSGMSRIQATRSSDGSYLMIYSPDGQTFNANLNKLSGITVKAYWYNPRTGAATVINNITKGASVQFIPPSQGSNNDWVLIVDDASRNFSTPGI